MLNLSENSIQDKIKKESFNSFWMTKNYRSSRILSRLLLISFGVFLILLFLPWTQNIRSRGFVTTLHPEQRPQTINSVIAGKIEKWFVTEGDLVQKGDTILFISEVKDDYMDPQLLQRTEEQIKTKELAVQSYMEKVRALDNQIDALIQTKKLKLEQARNYIKQAKLKIESDSLGYEAARTDYSIAQEQFKRAQELYKDGLKSLTDLEKRKQKMQETKSKEIAAENKLLESRNKYINAEVEEASVENQYNDKLAKAESEKFATLSKMYDAEAVVTKMQNQYMNYSIRSGLYYILAPQDGFITKAIKNGIGETIKEGEELISIMPATYDIAVAMYVDPMDLPLIKKGQHVRFRFDGWPSVIFSGWPDLSAGTFGGDVAAIDNFISDNGKYRILVAPTPGETPWPDVLRIGSGADGMALLQDVPIWYELWRNLNGFPPDFYKSKDPSQTAHKTKKK